MFNTQKRKAQRMLEVSTRPVSDQKYNFIIGAVLLYGFLMNALLAAIAGPLVASINPIALIIGYFICCIAGSIIVNVSKHPVGSFIGFNLIAVPIGALLSICLPNYPTENIIAAMLTTAAVTVVMMIISSIKPQWFAKLGPVLFFSLLIGLIAELVAMLCGYGGDIFNWFFVLVFSAYIGFDWYKAAQYQKTVDNAVDSAVDLYLDIINLFLRLLDIFSKDD